MRQPEQLDGGLVIREVAAGLDDLLRFAAIAVATLYHYAFGPDAPYPFLCLPVLPGTFGGIELIADQRDCCG